MAEEQFEIVDEEPDAPIATPTAADDSGEAGVILASEVLPSTLVLVPIGPRPFFPGMPVPLQVIGPERLEMLKRVLSSPARAVGLVLVKDASASDEPENLYSVGVAARVLKVIGGDVDRVQVLVHTLSRFRVDAATKTPHGVVANVTYHHPRQHPATVELRAYSLAVISTLKELMQVHPLYAEGIRAFFAHSNMDDPGQLADFAATLTTAEGAELQKVLETFDVRRRIDRVLGLLKKELEVALLQQKINKQIEEKMSKNQREFFLREQLKEIKKELGLEKEGKDAEIEKFAARLEKLVLNAEARRAVDDEMSKLKILEPLSPEYTVSRNYLDWLTVLPWGKLSRDSYDLERARRVLDRDHFGLQDVKDRILEFIAVGKVKGDISGSILCLVGPPGVGKTSVGRSIANALDRTFFRFSLGGMRDEAEIKGHRRTYIGAIPGKFLQALKSAGTANPVLMLDEIDKIGASFQGDPASALLEVLDPEQNSSFRDHYLDVPFDLSNVLFIATANQLDTIPAPLLDRMETIRLSGYILEEKVEIARRYLVPKQAEKHGLAKGAVRFRAEALRAIIDGYAREAGVRGLEGQIKKIMRKAAMAAATWGTGRIVVGERAVETYLGKPLFTEEAIEAPAPGVVTGLAWTSLGGATLQIEATAMLAKGKGFKQTGQLGEVMVESSEIAYSFVMANLKRLGAEADFFETHFVHLHVPAGATKKDGPSAGVTMATALVSMIERRAVRERLGMTGELTLQGRVLPIGGVKEKVIAARRVGLVRLILPEANRKDFEELPDYLRADLEVTFARHYWDVYAAAFGAPTGDTDRRRAPRRSGSRRAGAATGAEPAPETAASSRNPAQ
ncbi:MAG: endopeptidase La [Candidatus Schekmanbacteria bacterium]|nr:endopeptidase La [Candidatus Schekmanbacteria bacterium]